MSGYRLFVSMLVLFLVAASAPASTHTFVQDGRLMVSEGEGRLVARELPVEPGHAFGTTAAGQVLFTSKPAGHAEHTDAMVGTVDLWVLDNDGETRQLTADELVVSAQWSNALDKIVVWTGEKKVYAMNLDGGAREELVDNAITPALSPDGRQLAYVRTPADWLWNELDVAFQVRVLNLDTGKDRAILNGTDANELIWTPDGEFILFQGKGNGVTGLWRVSARGGDAEQLTNAGQWTAKNAHFVKNPSRNTDVSWSEDGKHLLYGATYSTQGEVTVLEFDKVYGVRRAMELTTGKFPYWENGVVMVPRPEVSSLREKSLPFTMGSAEFPVDVELAAKVVDVASAPRKFARPASMDKVPDTIPTKAVSKYRYPFHSSAGYPYSAYYDNDNGGGLLDWKCASYTYNNHRGTDIAVACGWWVYAGAYGTLYSWNDGCPTYGYWGSGCGGGFGNYIKLSHGAASGRNWYTIEAHLYNGTVNPQTHSCGSRVGISGSSGNSTGCHLHFEVNAYGHPYDDPFAGSCSGSVSYWCNQNGGYPTTGCC
jgi:hypothetical protein